jgi:NADP-dependent 3-hydroxy acid dehydrogenase YdfG
MKESLSGKVAVVTGASAGIGAAVAEELARCGAAVVLQARRGEKLREVAKNIEKSGGKALAVEGDASVQKDIDRLLEEALNWGGRLDAAVVNAGRGLAGSLLTSDLSQWEQMYAVNVMGAAYLMRRAGEHFARQQSGDIVVLSSVAGHNISPFSGFYGSSKWAVWAAAEALRRELCPKKVRVTTVKPGIVLSEFQEVAGYNEDNFYKGIQRFGTLLEPADVARAIAFVLSQPAHVHINELVIRPTGQDYP